MTNIQRNFKVCIPTTDHAEEICNIIIQSITQVCAVDYKNDPVIIDEWLSNKTPENVAQWLQSSSNRSCAVVDVERNKLIGYALMNNDGEILLNYVLPDYLSMGIGKTLLNKIEDMARDLKLNKLLAVSTITAKKFYERNGFIKNGEPEYVGQILGDFPLVKYLDSI